MWLKKAASAGFVGLEVLSRQVMGEERLPLYPIYREGGLDALFALVSPEDRWRLVMSATIRGTKPTLIPSDQGRNGLSNQLRTPRKEITVATTPEAKGPIGRVRQELDGIRQIKKCAGCECLLDVLWAVQTDLEGIDVPEAASVREEMREWFEAGNAKRHRCLGCEVCLPTEPYNRFSAFVKEAGVDRRDPSQSVPEEPGACDCGVT